MKRSKPMNRGSGAGLSRSAPMKRSKPLAQRSKKQTRVYAGDAAVGLEGRRDFVARILGERSACEACAPIDLMLGAHARAPHRATEVHEILRRSAGGSVVDDSNVAAVCRRAHAWIHEHPKEARELGLLHSRYSQPTASENR